MKKIITQLVASATTLSATAFGFFFAAPAQAIIVQFGGNGNYYELVKNELSYLDAFNDAASRTFNGLNGHLATITSQAENDFLVSQFASEFSSDNVLGAWLGGQKIGNTWEWTTGLEAGLQFWQGASPNNGGSGFNGVYVNWADDFWPDNAAPPENNLRMLFVEEIFFGGKSSFQPGDWDDLNGTTRQQYYIVEYSQVPEPFTILGSLTALGMGAALKKKLATVEKN